MINMRFGKKLISCEIAPNNTLIEGFLALALIFALPFVHQKRLKVTKNTLFTPKKTYFVDSGRTALTILLESLQLPGESEVMIQGFSCIVVPNSVMQAGLKPVLVDINKEDYNLNLNDAQIKLSKNTRVLVLQYPFGVIPDVEKYIEFCKINNLILIEDCAHSLGSRVVIAGKKHKIGSLGNGSVYSFGRDKIISTTVGGVIQLNTNSKTQNDFVESKVNSLPLMSYRKQFQSLYYIFAATVIIRPFYHIGIGKMWLFLSKKFHFIDEIYTKLEKEGTKKLNLPSKYPFSLGIILNRQIKKFPQTYSHRLSVAEIYCNNLNLKFESMNSFMRFPLICNNSKVYTEILRKCKEEGILLGTWYNSIFIPDTVNLSFFSFDSKDVPICNDFTQQKILNLPTNRYTSLSDAKKIADLIVSVQKPQQARGKMQTR
jgi:perosamine synthetase